MDDAKGGFTTRVKDFFARTGSRFKLGKGESFRPDLDDSGLLSQDADSGEQQTAHQSHTAVVKAAPESARNEQIEKLQDGFNRLINRLETINDNLSQQVEHQQQLMERLDKLPQMFESFAPSIKNQQELTEQVIEELKGSATRNQKFVDAVEAIPTETAKQTDALQSIDHQLAAAADCDAQLTQSFSKFQQSIDRLDTTASSQTDSIMQMSKTFAASDRYLKYIISRDKKRMFWLLVISLSVCAAVILILVGIILYLGR